MTETQTPAETTETPAVSLDSLGDFERAFANRLIAEIEDHNKIVAKIKASSSNLDDVMDAVRADTSDKKVADATKKIESLNAELEKVETTLRDYVKSVAEKRLSEQKETDTSGLDEQRKALSTKIAQGVNYLAGETGVDKKALPLPKIATLRGVSSGEGNGAGGRRLRGFTVSVDGKDALMGGKSSFSAGAKAAGVDTPELQQAYAKATDNPDLDPKKFPARAEFTVNGHTVVAYYTEGGAATERAAQ